MRKSFHPFPLVHSPIPHSFPSPPAMLRFCLGTFREKDTEFLQHHNERRKRKKKEQREKTKWRLPFIKSKFPRSKPKTAKSQKPKSQNPRTEKRVPRAVYKKIEVRITEHKDSPRIIRSLLGKKPSHLLIPMNPS